MTVRRPPLRVGGALPYLGLVGLLGLVGCTASSDSTAQAPSSSSVSTSAAVTTTAAPAFELPATCADLLTVAQVTDGLGVRLPGTTSFVLGQPKPDIGRTGRVTCGYGVTAATDTAGESDPLLEVSVFVYSDPQAAADRAQAVQGSREAQGVRVDPATVPGADALLFSSPDDTTLIATVAERTYALTLVPGLLDPPGTQAALQTLAAEAIAAGPAATSGSPAT